MTILTPFFLSVQDSNYTDFINSLKNDYSGDKIMIAFPSQALLTDDQVDYLEDCDVITDSDGETYKILPGLLADKGKPAGPDGLEDPGVPY
jgi:hypothetical protein